jgi:CheY-like chemotaxis protein
MSNSATIQVLLVDDHAIVRDGLCSVLEATGEIACTQAESAEQALELLDAECLIDVVLLDITLPGMSGLEALAEIHKRLPKLAVLLLSMHPEDQFAVRAFAHGSNRLPQQERTLRRDLESRQGCCERNVLFVQTFGLPGSTWHRRSGRSTAS